MTIFFTLFITHLSKLLWYTFVSKIMGKQNYYLASFIIVAVLVVVHLIRKTTQGATQSSPKFKYPVQTRGRTSKEFWRGDMKLDHFLMS